MCGYSSLANVPNRVPSSASLHCRLCHQYVPNTQTPEYASLVLSTQKAVGCNLLGCWQQEEECKKRHSSRVEHYRVMTPGIHSAKNLCPVAQYKLICSHPVVSDLSCLHSVRDLITRVRKSLTQNK